MRTRAALLLIAPATIFYVFSFAIPLTMAGRLSFFTLDKGDLLFVGIKNYIRAFEDPLFWKSFVNVGWFVLFIAPPSIAIPYWIAILLQRFGRKMQSVGRFICYVPNLTSGLIIALLWKWLLERSGLINQILAHIGLPGIGWFGEPMWSRVAVALVALSGGSGVMVILFSAVILSIPQELRDAATVDGATEGQYRRMVIRPLLMPTILLALLLTIVGTIQSWESIYVLFSSGGPKGAALTPVYDIFMTAFMFSRPFYASAKGMLLLMVIAAVVFLKQKTETWAGMNR